MKPFSYTWLHPKHQLLAMSIPLDIAHVPNCFHFGVDIFERIYSLPNTLVNIFVRVLFTMSYILNLIKHYVTLYTILFNS